MSLLLKISAEGILDVKSSDLGSVDSKLISISKKNQIYSITIAEYKILGANVQVEKFDELLIAQLENVDNVVNIRIVTMNRQAKDNAFTVMIFTRKDTVMTELRGIQLVSNRDRTPSNNTNNVMAGVPSSVPPTTPKVRI